MMAGLGYGVWPCPSVRDRIQNVGQISQSRVSPDLHLSIQALYKLILIGLKLSPPPFRPFLLFFFILTLFGWLRSSRRLTTDWALHCTARRNSPFNGLRVIDRRILWHRSLGSTSISFSLMVGLYARGWRRGCCRTPRSYEQVRHQI